MSPLNTQTRRRRTAQREPADHSITATPKRQRSCPPAKQPRDLSSRRALKRQDHQLSTVTLRRSSRLKAKSLPESLPQSPETSDKPDTLDESLRTDSNNPRTDLQTSDSPAVLTLVSVKQKPLQEEQSDQPQTPLVPQPQDLKDSSSVVPKTEIPLKFDQLTERNLRAHQREMGDKQKTAVEELSGTRMSSRTTTTDNGFDRKLQRNNIIPASFSQQTADDIAEIRELLNKAQQPSLLPDRLTYETYCRLNRHGSNELATQICSFPLLAKRVLEREVAGYFQRPNLRWSEVNNHLTDGLSSATPDMIESYCACDYPPTVVDSLSEILAPSSSDAGMPAFAVEFKRSGGNMDQAELQSAYDGAIMTDGAQAIHEYLGKPADAFYGKTQALTVTFNGGLLKFYGHHAAPIGRSLQNLTDNAEDALQYTQYLLASCCPGDSFEDFQIASMRLRNAQDIGYRWATERKDELWAYIQSKPPVPRLRYNLNTGN